MDWSRTGKRSFFRLFTDDLGRTVPVRWYRAPDGAEFFPGPHTFGNSDWFPDEADTVAVGDYNYTPRRFDKGNAPGILKGQAHCGPLQYFQSGVVLARNPVLLPPDPRDGLPFCCKGIPIEIGAVGLVGDGHAAPPGPFPSVGNLGLVGDGHATPPGPFPSVGNLGLSGDGHVLPPGPTAEQGWLALTGVSHATPPQWFVGVPLFGAGGEGNASAIGGEHREGHLSLSGDGNVIPPGPTAGEAWLGLSGDGHPSAIGGGVREGDLSFSGNGNAAPPGPTGGQGWLALSGDGRPSAIGGDTREGDLGLSGDGHATAMPAGGGEGDLGLSGDGNSSSGGGGGGGGPPDCPGYTTIAVPSDTPVTSSSGVVGFQFAAVAGTSYFVHVVVTDGFAGNTNIYTGSCDSKAEVTNFPTGDGCYSFTPEANTVVFIELTPNLIGSTSWTLSVGIGGCG